MAALARRTWAEIATETQRRLGGINYSGATTRIQYWIEAAYLYLCTCYHHFELHAIDTSKTLSTSVNTLVLPTDCFILIAMRMKDPDTGKYIGPIGPFDAAPNMVVGYTNEVGRPTRYNRFISTLHFDYIADKAYPVDLFYYRFPASPDFTGSASPEIGRDCDEHIIEGAMRLGWPGVARPDLGDPERQLLTEWLAEMVRPTLISDPIPWARERNATARTIGGPQG